MSARASGSRIDGERVLFVFDEALLQGRPVTSVEVRGSFTAWEERPGWALRRADRGLWLLEKPLALVSVPGNSGQPEFKFVVDGRDWVGPPAAAGPGHRFRDHFVLLTSDDPAEMAQKDRLARRRIETKAAYRTYVGEEEAAVVAAMTNFRGVEGGRLGPRILFRSYHPFIGSRSDYPVEPERLRAVQDLMERAGIRSVVCLSGKEGGPGGLYGRLAESGSVHYEDIGYALVYYGSDSPEMALTMRRIALFLIAREPPFLVHCRLGTDRTGVVVAFLAALGGASLDDILADYQRSNLLGVEEYRDARLLRYALERMLETDITSRRDLSAAAGRYLRLRAGLTETQVEALRQKLGGDR